MEILYGLNGMLEPIVKFLREAAMKGGIWSAKVVRIADDIAEDRLFDHDYVDQTWVHYMTEELVSHDLLSMPQGDRPIMMVCACDYLGFLKQKDVVGVIRVDYGAKWELELYAYIERKPTQYVQDFRPGNCINAEHAMTCCFDDAEEKLTSERRSDVIARRVMVARIARFPQEVRHMLADLDTKHQIPYYKVVDAIRVRGGKVLKLVF